jgi:hypothetical protein
MKILKERNVSAVDRIRLTEVQAAVQASKSQSEDTNNRRNRILLQLFHKFQELVVYITLYRGVLPKLEGYIKLFQSEEPLVHLQHVKMFQVTREFLLLFMKPQALPKTSVKKLLQVNVGKAEHQLHRNNLYVGQYCFPEVQKAKIEKSKNLWLTDFLQALKTGYQLAGKYLLQNLPLQNRTLQLLSSLDPELRVLDTTITSLESLGKMMPNVIAANQQGILHDEIRSYVGNPHLQHVHNLYRDKKALGLSPPRIDTDWWSIVSTTQNYPTLSKLTKACLTIFSGPLVEGSFNIMDDIITDDRSRLCIENYEACAHIKYNLRSIRKKSTEMNVSTNMLKSCNEAHKNYKEHLQNKKLIKEQKNEAKVRKALLNAKTKQAKALLKKLSKKTAGKPVHRVTSSHPVSAPIAVNSQSASSPQPAVPHSNPVESPQPIGSQAPLNIPGAQPLKRKCTGTLTSWLVPKSKKHQ